MPSSNSSKGRGLGLGEGESTRPTREERRREVERVHADEGAPDSGASEAPAVITKLMPRKRPAKVPFNTYVQGGTQRRIEWLKGQGYAVTDIVDLALNEFLDRAGAPKASDE